MMMGTKADLREMELRLIAPLRSEMNRRMLAVIGALTVSDRMYRHPAINSARASLGFGAGFV